MLMKAERKTTMMVKTPTRVLFSLDWTILLERVCRGTGNSWEGVGGHGGGRGGKERNQFTQWKCILKWFICPNVANFIMQVSLWVISEKTHSSQNVLIYPFFRKLGKSVELLSLWTVKHCRIIMLETEENNVITQLQFIFWLTVWLADWFLILWRQRCPTFAEKTPDMYDGNYKTKPVTKHEFLL